MLSCSTVFEVLVPIIAVIILVIIRGVVHIDDIDAGNPFFVRISPLRTHNGGRLRACAGLYLQYNQSVGTPLINTAAAFGCGSSVPYDDPFPQAIGYAPGPGATQQQGLRCFSGSDMPSSSCSLVVCR